MELPSRPGYLEALYGAAPLLAELGAGEVRLHGGTSGDQKFFVAWGFVEVLPERVTILAETALRPNEIDRAEARRSSKGEKMWHEAGDDGEKYDEANAVTRQAEEKLASAEGKKPLASVTFTGTNRKARHRAGPFYFSSACTLGDMRA